MSRSKDLNLMLFNEFGQKLPQFIHHGVVETVVDLVDQENTIPRRSQFNDDREQAHYTLSSNRKRNKGVQTDIEVDGRAIRLGKDLNSLHIWLDDVNCVDA